MKRESKSFRCIRLIQLLQFFRLEVSPMERIESIERLEVTESIEIRREVKESNDFIYSVEINGESN